MATKYFALLTNIGAAKLAKATALGTKVEITQMAVGDGNGVLPTPDPAQTALIHEIRRAPLNMLTVDPANASQIIAEQVIPEDVGGWWIREIGLFDKDGDMIAVANCAETYKPQLQEGSGRVQAIRVILIVSSTEAVTLKIDPAVVLATRKYVDDKAIEIKLYVDNQIAKHLAAADPHTQYAPKESPTLTGMPKAPTAAAGTSTTQIATTAFVQAVVTVLNSALALKAPLASPGLTGTPTAPTAAQSTNNTQIATTAFVKSAIAALVASSPAALDTLNELAAALGNDPNFATTMTNALAGKQPLDNTLTALSGKSVSALLEYLGLGEIAKAGVGSGRLGSNGYATLPIIIDGTKRSLIIQWGISVTTSMTLPTTSSTVNYTDVTLPASLPGGIGQAVAGYNNSTDTFMAVASAEIISPTTLRLKSLNFNLNNSSLVVSGGVSTSIRWLVIGVA